MPPSFKPASTFSRTVMAGNGFGFWNTIPILLRTSWARIPRP